MKYLTLIPKTLQEDFIDNRVVPFIGAGFSRNAVISNNITIPDWDGLGKAVASYIPNYEYINASDSLSLFETEFSRTKLIEIMAKELNINSIKPGTAHNAFCDLNFATICTTNFDFLIEQTLNEKSIPFSTIVSEDRLPISIREKTKLIKLHGDFNHPERMIITETDYDCYLDKNKVLSTYISNIFITKTLLLIGYSFDDYDIRTLWNIIGSRLGKLKNPAYIVLVGATSIEISRFERRNVKVINLPGEKENYNQILKDFFIEIKSLINSKAPTKIVLTNEKANQEFKMPTTESKLCFISASSKRISRLKEVIYPILLKNNVTPITLDEVIMTGEIWTRKVDLIVNQCFMSIVDISDNNANVIWELRNIIEKKKQVILVVDQELTNTIPFNIAEMGYISYSLIEENDEFIRKLDNEIGNILKKQEYKENLNEHFSLLDKGEYNAAIISVFRYLEKTLAKRFDNNNNYPLSLSNYLNLLEINNPQDSEIINKLKYYLRIRNRIVHMDINVKKKDANTIVQFVNEICEIINNGEL